MEPKQRGISMKFQIDLEYTPRSPIPGVPFTESSFSRRKTSFTLDTKEIGVALIDLWNFGWEDGPLVAELGAELSLERGISHAVRKRNIIENRISPAVNELRKLGVQIFHCNHAHFLQKYPEWHDSTTQEERESLALQDDSPSYTVMQHPEDWPPADWITSWKDMHRDHIDNLEWLEKQGEVYEQMDIPEPVKPRRGDLLVFSQEQFHRLLTEKKIRTLFYMGFETSECVRYSPYGMQNMNGYGYMCNIVRDCTATYETAETLDGLWKTRVHIIEMEAKYGYSVTSASLVAAVKTAK